MTPRWRSSCSEVGAYQCVLVAEQGQPGMEGREAFERLTDDRRNIVDELPHRLSSRNPAPGRRRFMQHDTGDVCTIGVQEERAERLGGSGLLAL